jgi:glycosyltransferase involved in cell wall biosynthesis
VPLVCKVEGFTYVCPTSRRLERSVDLFVPVTRAVSERLLKMGVPQDRIVVTYCPIDVVEYDPTRLVATGEFRQSDGRSDLLAFGIIGQLLEWKGQHVFLEAAKRVFDRCNNCVAVIVGGEPGRSGKQMEYLRDYAAKLAIADRVRFTGHRSDVPQVMAELDVVVHASIKPEPFGTVVAEAMAMKRAVIAARNGGMPEYVEDGVNGLLSTPGDAGQLAEAILRLLGDADLRRRMGENGRRTVIERFAADKHALQAQALLDSAIESHKHRRDLRRRHRQPAAWAP